MRHSPIEWAVGAVFVGLVATFVGLAIRECGDQRRCESAGGRVERYNERTILVPMSCGSGCTMLVPEQVSDWRCVGAMPESP